MLFGFFFIYIFVFNMRSDLRGKISRFPYIIDKKQCLAG